MGNAHFEDRIRKIKGLPLLSTDFFNWLKLTVSICLIVLKLFHPKPQKFSQNFCHLTDIVRKVWSCRMQRFERNSPFRTSGIKRLYNILVVCCCAFRTGIDCMLLSRTCRPTGICWSGRENSWRRRRKSRWQDRRSITLYLRALSTFSWICGT